MTAATLMKRINTQRKEIVRYEKEIKAQKKHLKEAEEENVPGLEFVREHTAKWIAYYRKQIERVEKLIAEMSKQAAELATEEEEREMIKAMADDMAKRGFANRGFTTKGLRYVIDGNRYGYTDRTLHCYTMRIEGKGTVFTSGTLETVAAYILKN